MQSRTLARAWCHPQWVGLPSTDTIMIAHHRQAQRPTSQVVLGSLELTSPVGPQAGSNRPIIPPDKWKLDQVT